MRTSTNLKIPFLISRPFRFIFTALAFFISTNPPPSIAQEIDKPAHAIAMHGKPALPADFPHFNYVNPDAPKGGMLRYGVYGTFDSLNPFIVKGAASAARGIWENIAGQNVFEPLLHRNRDEPFSLYGLLAQSVQTDAERTYVEFKLRPQARFSDGSPVTNEDVLFSIKLLGEKGRPVYRARWKKIERAELTPDNGVRFIFNKTADRELPLLLGMMPIFPKHATNVENFDKTSLKPMIGSGPYLVSDVKAGERIDLKLRSDYWAKDLPVKRGFDNFGTLRFEYFRNQSSLFEGFKKGLYDLRFENSPQQWLKSYNFAAVKDGQIRKLDFVKQIPAPMFGFVYNSRREKFADPNVRQALSILFDFEWVNKNLFANAYTRSQSFWHGSALSSHGKPANQLELELLGDNLEEISPEILNGTYKLPVSNASGKDRKILKAAFLAFKKAGYRTKNGKLVDSKGNPFRFEILIGKKSEERLALAWKQNVAALGIDMEIRLVDQAQYERLRQNYEFDVTPMTYYASFSPGAEQIWRWASKSRDVVGTFNLAGAKNPVIDRVIDALIDARDQESFHSSIRAFDRLLLNGHYLLPLFNLASQWIAVRSNIAGPQETPLYGVQLPTWWDKNAAAN